MNNDKKPENIIKNLESTPMPSPKDYFPFSALDDEAPKGICPYTMQKCEPPTKKEIVLCLLFILAIIGVAFGVSYWLLKLTSLY